MSQFEGTKFCMHCGAEVSPNAKFCSSCGGKLEFASQAEDWYRTENEEYTAQQASAGERAAGWFDKNFNAVKEFLEQPNYVPDEDREAMFIETKTEYYTACFSEMRKLQKKVKLNWAALFFGVLWMLYRKMYGVAAATFGAIVLVGLTGSLSGILGLALTVCCGLYGNYLYMMTVQSRVTESEKHSDPALTMYIEKYKGVNKTAPIIGVVVLAVALLPIFLIFGFSFLAMML